MRRYMQAEFNAIGARASRLIDPSRALAGAAVAVALGGLGAGLLAPTSIAASKKTAKAASSSLIHACYNKRTGALRVISGSRRCGSGGVAVSWTVEGIAGPRGATGEAGSLLGPRGLSGEVGPAGPAGPQGPAGEAAARGAAGAAGATGVMGETGANGAQGKAGATGPEGPAGKAGENGKNGVAGATGPTGTAGPPGPIGPTGSLGETLPEGKTETGAWSATSASIVEASEPGKPRELSATISFPIPLAKAPVKVTYLTKAQTEAGTPECPRTEALEKPTAKSGNLCIYTAQEEGGTNLVAFKDVQNVLGELGKASATGAFVIFETAKTEQNVVVFRGTWAVTG
jgi:hypothetical protein